MATTSSPSHPQPEQHDVVQPKTLDLPHSPQLIPDDDNQQSATAPIPLPLPEPILLTDDPVTSPPPPLTSRVNKRKKPGTRNKTYKRKRPTKRVQNLTNVINPIPFVRTETLGLDKHEEVLKRLGLYEFSRIELDRSLRTDLIVQLIVNYDAKKRCSYVNDLRINVNRAELARALKLPAGRQDRGSGGGVEEVDLDSEVFSDEDIEFIEDFVANWIVLRDGASVVPSEIVNWTRCIRDGHPEKMDAASLIWYKVEKELTQGDKLVDCYYASHLQYLIRLKRPEFFKEENGDDEDGEEFVIVDEEKEEKENVIVDEEKEEKEEKEFVIVDEEKEEKEEKENVIVDEEKEEKENVTVDEEKKEEKENENVIVDEEKEEKEEQEEKEEEKDESGANKEAKDEKEEEKDEKEVEEENVSIVQEPSIELNLGMDVEGIAYEEATKDDEMMEDAEEGNEEMGEQVNFKNMLGDHFLQRCQSSDLNNFEDVKVQEVEDEQDEQIEHVEDEDEEEEEEEEDEEGGERLDEGFDMEANDDTFDRDGLTDNFLQGVETSHNPYNSHGMSSMDLFGSRDASFMSHGGPSFYSNGGKRVMEPEDDIHHLDQNNKRLKTDELWDQKQNDIGFCFDQMQQLMQKAKMIHEEKERSYENLQYSQQMAVDQLQERQQIMEMIIKSKDEELEKKHAEVFRLERELYLMGDLLAGYRKALNDTRFKFSEYRKRFPLKEEPLYKDAGPGGLVLSTREIEKQRLKREEDMMKFQILAKDIEDQYVYQLELQHNRLSPMVDKLVFIENEVQRLKEVAAQPKETRADPSAELEPSVEQEEIQKLVDKDEASVEPEKNQNSMDEDASVEPEKNQQAMDEDESFFEPEKNQKSINEDELAIEPEKNQKSMNEDELTIEPEKNQKSMNEDELAIEPEKNQKSMNEDEVIVEPEKNQKSLDEIPENDASMEDVPANADESEEKRTGEED